LVSVDKEPKLKKAYDNHFQMTVKSIEDLVSVANTLKTRPEVLAVEYLDRKRIFGDKANINEMSKFKSKVKK